MSPSLDGPGGGFPTHGGSSFADGGGVVFRARRIDELGVLSDPSIQMLFIDSNCPTKPDNSQPPFLDRDSQGRLGDLQIVGGLLER